jgi:hydrogenase maturation protease
MTMKTLVVGLGNPILGDDGVGWKVADQVEERLAQTASLQLPTSNIHIDCVALGGLSLMEHLIGYEHAIVIDAIGTGQHPIGTAYHFRLDDLYDPTTGHTTAAHDVSLITALKMGRSLGAALPDRIDVVAIESPYVYDFTEELTPPVAAAVPQAVELVMQLLSPSPEIVVAQTLSAPRSGGPLGVISGEGQGVRPGGTTL